MKLLIVVPGGVPPGGVLKVIPTLLALLKKMGERHETVVVALNQHSVLTEYELHGCRVVSLPPARLGRMGAVCRLVRRRLRDRAFKPDLVHGFWLGKTGLLSALLSKMYRVPYFATIAGGEPVHIPELGFGGSRTLPYRWLNAGLLKSAGGVSCGSRFVRALAEDRWNIRPELIPLGIDTRLWNSGACAGEPERCWNLVQVASINRVKDPRLLIEVLRRLNRIGFGFRMNWVGEDTLGGEIQKLARQAGLDHRIVFHGFKTQERLKALLKEQHFIIQTSRYESQGIALAEACSQGVCPVGTDVGWLSDMGSGIPGHGDGVAEMIAREVVSLSKNYRLRRARVRRGQFWLGHNHIGVTASRFDGCYEKLLSC